MKKLLLPFMLLFVLGVVYVINGTDGVNQPVQKITAADQEAIPKINEIPQTRPAATYLNRIVANQITNVVDPVDVMNEYKAVKEHKEATNKTSTLDQDVEWTNLGPNNVGGRTRAFLIDNEDDQTLYASSVTGGVFKSTNGGNNWSVLQSSIDAGCAPVASMAQADNGDIYLGTGSDYENNILESGSFGSQSVTYPGTGIFRSTDGGDTFESLIAPDTNVSNDVWTAINSIETYTRGGNIYVYAATNRGLRISTDGGENWEIPNDDAGNPLPGAGVTDVIAHDIDIDSEGHVYCAVNADFWKSTDGETFFKLNGNGDLPNVIPGGRKIVSVSPSDPDFVYIASSNNTLTGLWQSKDGGETFSLLASGSQFLNIETQGGYDFCLDIDPNNPEKIYLGGIRLWTWSIADGWTRVELYSANPGNPKWIHADKQGLFYHPTNSNILYITCDGGVFKSENATLAYPDFKGLNKNYNTFQCYSVAAGHDGVVMAGAQDNGTQLLTYNYNSFQSASDAYGGDGAFTDISNINPNIMFAGTQNQEPSFGSLLRSTNGGESFGCAINYVPDDPAHSSAEDGRCEVSGGAFFIQPFLLWEDTRLFYEVSSWKPDEINMVQTTIDGETATVPEFIIDGESVLITPDFQGDLATIDGHNGQSFIVTTDVAKYNQIPDDPYVVDEMYVQYQVTLEPKEEDDGSFTYELEDYGFVIAPSDSRFARARMFIGSLSGKLWMTEDALNPSVTPAWSDLTHQEILGTTTPVTAQGEVSCLATSSDGDRVIVGTTSGRLLLVTNLNRLDGEFPIARRIVGQLGRYITNIAIDPSNDKRVVFTCGNYGNDSYIYETANIDADNVVFESIQNDLPKGPIYAVEILQQGNETFAGNVSKGIVIGSRYGIWYTKKSGGTYAWENQSTGMGAVPVYALRQEPMAREASRTSDNWRCQILYAGTHARGMFRTTTFTDENIPESVYDLPEFQVDPNVSVEETANSLSTLKVYPNPIVNQATIEFSLSQSANVTLEIFDIQGRLISQKDQGKMQVGKQQIKIDVSELVPNNYVLSITTATERLAEKIIVTR